MARTDDESDVGVVVLPAAGHEGAGGVVQHGAHLDLHILGAADRDVRSSRRDGTIRGGGLKI